MLWAESYMKRIQRAEEELKTLSAKRRHYIELATMISPGTGGTVHSKTDNTSRVETAAVNLADLITKLDVKEREYAAAVSEAEEMIEKIPQDRYRRFLTLHYLCGMSMASVSDEMDYKDSKSVYKVKNWALRELQKIMVVKPPVKMLK